MYRPFLIRNKVPIKSTLICIRYHTAFDYSILKKIEYLSGLLVNQDKHQIHYASSVYGCRSWLHLQCVYGVHVFACAFDSSYE